MWPRMEWWSQTHMHGENAPWDKFPILSDVEVPRLDPHQIIEGELQNQPALCTHLRMQTFRNLWVLKTTSFSHHEEICFSSERDRMHHLNAGDIFQILSQLGFLNQIQIELRSHFLMKGDYVVYLNRKPPKWKFLRQAYTNTKQQNAEYIQRS